MSGGDEVLREAEEIIEQWLCELDEAHEAMAATRETMLAEATAEAARVLADAETHAGHLTATARDEAEEIIAAAHQEARRRLAQIEEEADRRRAQIEADLDRLRAVSGESIDAARALAAAEAAATKGLDRGDLHAVLTATAQLRRELARVAGADEPEVDGTAPPKPPPTHRAPRRGLGRLFRRG